MYAGEAEAPAGMTIATAKSITGSQRTTIDRAIKTKAPIPTEEKILTTMTSALRQKDVTMIILETMEDMMEKEITSKMTAAIRKTISMEITTRKGDGGKRMLRVKSLLLRAVYPYQKFSKVATKRLD